MKIKVGELNLIRLHFKLKKKIIIIIYTFNLLLPLKVFQFFFGSTLDPVILKVDCGSGFSLGSDADLVFLWDVMWIQFFSWWSNVDPVFFWWIECESGFSW